MAQLIAPFQIKGSLDNTSFYPHKNGKCVIRKRRPSTADKFYNSPKYERCRENVSEFTACSRAASRICKGFQYYNTWLSDGNYYNRMVGLLKMIAATSEADRGLRSCFDGNMHLLEDFSFNSKRSFQEAIDTEFTTQIDHVTGTMRLDMAAFSPLANVKAPARAKYFQVIIKGVALVGRDVRSVTEVTDLLPLNSTELMSVNLSLELSAAPGELLMFGAGVIFFEEYMGLPVTLRGGAFDILEVAKPVTENEADSHQGQDAAQQKARRLATALERLETMSLRGNYLKGWGPASGSVNKVLVPDYETRQKKLALQLWLQKINKYRKG